MITRQTIVSSNELIQQNLEQAILFNFIEMESGFYDAVHLHPWHQIIYPLKGMLKTRSGDSQYFIPHHRALFIPAGTRHESWAMSDTTFVGIYLNPVNGRETPLECHAIEVSNFFRELILYLKKMHNDENREPKALSNIIEVLYDQIWTEKAIEFEISMPTDRRLMLIVNALLENPSLDFTLKDWSARVGASERTLSRLFKKELYLSYPQWRQRLRLIISLHGLEQGISVQNIAYQVGYQSSSSYIEAFKQSFKLTPQQYKRNNHELDFKYSVLKNK